MSPRPEMNRSRKPSARNDRPFSPRPSYGKIPREGSFSRDDVQKDRSDRAPRAERAGGRFDRSATGGDRPYRAPRSDDRGERGGFGRSDRPQRSFGFRSDRPHAGRGGSQRGNRLSPSTERDEPSSPLVERIDDLEARIAILEKMLATAQ